MTTAPLMRPLAPLAPAPPRPIAPAPRRQNTGPAPLAPAPQPRQQRPKILPAASSPSPASSVDSNNPPTPSDLQSQPQDVKAITAPASASAPSASGTVGVKPTKDWILPARAKPGRKPSQAEPPTKRKAQNRASQRAFRERKQSYLSSLEERIAAYEAGEVSKNVELQKVARNVKAENDALCKENERLRLRIAMLERQIGRTNASSGTTQTSSSSSSGHEVGCKAPAHEMPSRLRPSLPSSSLQPPSGPSVPLPRPRMLPAKAPSSLASPSRPLSTSSPITPAPSSVPLTSPTASTPSGSRAPPLVRRVSDARSSLSPPDSLAVRDRSCGFCTQSSPCVCLGEAVLRIDGYDENEQAGCFKKSSLREPDPLADGATRISVDSLLTTDSACGDSIYTDRPSRRAKLWPVIAAAAPPPQPPVIKITDPPPAPACSGDPTTCGACSTDPGLQAFCEAVSRNVAGSQREPAVLDAGNALPIRRRGETSRPPTQASVGGQKRRLWDVVPLDVLPQGGGSSRPPFITAGPIAPLPRRTHSHSRGLPPIRPPNCASAGSRFPSLASSRHRPRDDRATIPDAWRTITAHPRFPQWDGGLALLADVVSRKTESGGARAEAASGSSSRGRKPGQFPLESGQYTSIDPSEESGEERHKDTSTPAGPVAEDEIISPSRREVRVSDSDDEEEDADDVAAAPDRATPRGSVSPPPKRRRIYVERGALRDALRLLDGAGDERGSGGDACPCPWKPSA